GGSARARADGRDAARADGSDGPGARRCGGAPSRQRRTDTGTTRQPQRTLARSAEGPHTQAGRQAGPTARTGRGPGVRSRRPLPQEAGVMTMRWFVIACVLGSVSPVLADGKAEAKAHVERATAAHAAGRFADALEELTAAYGLDPQPELLFAI